MYQRNCILENIRQEIYVTMESGIKNWSQGVCVQTALNSSFALLSQLTINFLFVLTQLLNLADKRDAYSLLIQNLWYVLCMQYVQDVPFSFPERFNQVMIHDWTKNIKHHVADMYFLRNMCMYVRIYVLCI